MLLIHCPHCGPRDESEFAYGGPAAPRRPDNPDAFSNGDWVAYLTVPENPLGPVMEHWRHERGCGVWTAVWRDTRTHEITDGPDE